MKRTFLALTLAVLCFVAGCDIHWRPDSGAANPDNSGQSAVSVEAEKAVREKARLMAEVARKVAAKIRAGEFKSYSEVEDFEQPLNKAAVPNYEPLRNAQDAMLGKDGDGNLKLSGPEDAKVWEETAAGFDRVANGGAK